MSTSLLSLRSRISGQTKSIPTFPPKRLHIQAFRDYQSITPKEDEPVSLSRSLNLIAGIYISREKA